MTEDSCNSSFKSRHSNRGLLPAVIDLQGIATYAPAPIARFLPEHHAQFRGTGVRKNPGVKDVARSCYTSWLRMVVSAHKMGVPAFYENAVHVGEIGPGDTLGVGFAMLLSGAKHYSALDVVPIVNNFENKEILEEMILLFKNRTAIPGDDEYPKARPRLASYEFPAHIFTEEKLKYLLSEERLNKIRVALENYEAGNPQSATAEIIIDYSVPWDGASSLLERKEQLDLVVSSAAMEHVDSMWKTYDGLALIIKKGGYMAHVVDFKCHGTAGTWNGYFAYSDAWWKVIRGKCVYFINREPYSEHIKAILRDFTLVGSIKSTRPNTLARTDLAKKYATLLDDDLLTSEALIVAQKK